MRPRSKRFFAVSFIFILAVLAAFFLLSGGKKKEEGAVGKTKLLPPGYTVTVSVESQNAAGIMAETLRPGLYQNRVTAYGEVLSPEGLVSSYKNYISARSLVEKAGAQLKASEKEYARLKVLNADAKNVSDRQLQAAAAMLASDEADEAGALGALRSAKNVIGINWGTTLLKWVLGYTASLQRVIEAKDALVQLTLPSASSLTDIPAQVRIEPPSGGLVPARFVSRAVSTAPNIQGISFIYVAPALSGRLVPGMNVTAQMPSAGAQNGFFVPASAVVWMQDMAWVYVKESRTGFSRVELPTTTPISNGYFVTGVFSAGDRIVIKGAQALLSAESTLKSAGGGGGEGDDD